MCKKIIAVIISIVILCLGLLTGCAGCMDAPSRVETIRGVYDRHGNPICRCKNEYWDHEYASTYIKDIEVVTMSAVYDIKIKYYDGHIESIKAPVNSTYIYYVEDEGN